LKAKRFGSGRRATEQYADDQVGDYGHSYYGNDGWNDEVGNSFRWRGRGRGGGMNVVTELLAQMQQTAVLLERFVLAATAHRRNTPGRRRPTPKNADEEAPPAAPSKADKVAKNVADYFRQRSTAGGEGRVGGGSNRRPGKNTRRRGDRDRRLLHVTLLGRLDRLPARAGDRRAQKPQMGAKSQSDTSLKNANVQNSASRSELEERLESERRQQAEVDRPRTAAGVEDHDDDDNDDIEVMSDRIRSIIADPDASFSYDNISADDMVSLEEMVSQSSQFGTMKLVEKDEDEVDAAAAANTGPTTSATATVPGDGSSNAKKDDGDVMAKPVEQSAEIGSHTGDAPEAANSDAQPKAL